MSDMIATDAVTGEASFAFKGSRSMIWHGKGQQADDDADVAKMAELARWNFRIMANKARYNNGTANVVFPGYKALFHSVSLAPIGMVGEDFQVAQPAASQDLVERLVQVLDGKIDTMGVTHDGAGLFASIIVGESIRICGIDVVQPNALFATKNDGSAKSRVKFCVTRAVCRNTVQAALGEGKHAGDMVVSHRSQFRPEVIAAEMALRVAEWKATAEKFRLLSQTPVTMATADRIVFDVFNDRRSDASKADPKRDIRNGAGYKTILGLFAGAGRGAMLPGVKGTAWGLFNGFTEYLEHHATAKSVSHRFDSNLNGTAAEMKDAAFQKLMEVATAE